MTSEKRFRQAYHLSTNGESWYLMDTKGNVLKELNTSVVNAFISK